jgi:phosphatidylinositol alpha-1,6-mannosyltransferase
MKICIFTTDYPPTVGGIAVHTMRLSQALSEASEVEHVQVVALKNRHADREDISPKLSLVRAGHRSIVMLFLQVIRYGWRFRNHDIFHAASVFPVGFFTLLFAKYCLRKPVFVSFYGTDVLTSDGKWYTKWAKGFTLRHATKALAFGYSTRDLVAKKYGIDPDSFPITYTPFDITASPETPKREDIRAKYGIAIDDFVVLFVGNLVKRKGAELLVQALGKIVDESVKLIIVGEGPERKNLAHHISELHLENRVFLAGRVPEVGPYYAIADVFSMPSFFERGSDDIEGFGIVYLEAQVVGVPVIGTRSGGIPEALEEGVTGLLVDENDVPALAESIQCLKSDPELCKRMGERGRIFVAERFNSRDSVRRHLEAYRSL